MTTLYHYPLCPFSRKVRLLLRERSIDPDLITETFWGKRKEFLKMNPSGDVPVLIIKKRIHKILENFDTHQLSTETKQATSQYHLNETNILHGFIYNFLLLKTKLVFYIKNLEIILETRIGKLIFRDISFEESEPLNYSFKY